MHIDARKLDSNTIIQGDICIIGAGTAGISMALEWINTPYKVILLEGGGFKYDVKVQELNRGKLTGQKYYPLQSTRLRYFGGSTGHWAGYCSPMDPIDFKKKDYVPHSGWPIERKDLDPYYKQADELLGLDTNDYDYEYWKNVIKDTDPIPLTDDTIWNKIWKFSTSRFGPQFKDTIENAKNIHLYTYANAVDLKANEDISKIEEITVKNYENKTHKVRAKHFILACGAIQNARLLLASNSQAPEGLGNGHDLVGRYFMEHLEIASGEFWSTKYLDPLYTFPYGEVKVCAELAVTEKAQIEHQILNGTVSFQPLILNRRTKTHMETWQHEDPRKAKENMNTSADSQEKENEGSNDRAFQLYIRMEQAPNPNSRVTLGVEKDELGVPRANLHWELTTLEKRSIRKTIELIAEQAGLFGSGRVKLMEFLQDETVKTLPDNTNGGWHHMGTTRMHDSPTEGVVDRNCQVHGISNLYVAGSGCFTTGGSVNPTLSLVALTLRLSDYVKNKM